MCKFPDANTQEILETKAFQYFNLCNFTFSIFVVKFQNLPIKSMKNTFQTIQFLDR